MILLTDEEIIRVIDEASGGSLWRDGWEIQDVLEDQDRAIAKEQLKEVGDWGDEDCYDHNEAQRKEQGWRVKRRECPLCWEALLQEVKE